MSLFSRLFFPHKCIFCGTVLDLDWTLPDCKECREHLPRITGRICQKCGRPIETDHSLPVCLSCRKEKYPFHKVYVPFLYKDEVRQAILRLKFHEKRFIANPLADYLFQQITADCNRPTFDCVTAVPLASARKRSRGYNQSALLAARLAEKMNLPYYETLKKTKNTPKQSTLKYAQRKQNLKGAFTVCAPEKICGKTILLVDDVITTGATAAECTKMLRRSGAAQVCVAVIAATNLNHSNQS